MGPKLNVFTVRHGVEEMEVIIPLSEDKSENEYLEEMEREKTLAELKRRPPRIKSKISDNDKSEALREFRDYKKRKRENPNKKYY